MAGDSGVDVDVGNPVAEQAVALLLGPGGGAAQEVLLGVPIGEQDRPARPEPGPQCRSQRARDLQHGGRAAARVDGPVHPGVAVVADDDPLVPFGRPADGAQDVAHRADPFAVLDAQVDPDRPGADVVGERQAALPAGRDRGPRQPRQDLGGVLV